MQSFKRLDSLRQFCAVLQYGDGNSGEDFTDLPEMNSGTDKGEIEGRFELSPYFHSCRIPNFRNQGDYHHLQRVPTSTTLCHMLPVMVISIVRYRIMSFFVAKGITAVLKGGAEIMRHRLAHRESTASNPDKRYHIGVTRCHFQKKHCWAVDYIFLYSKRNNNNKKKDNMEIVSIERKTFEAMVAKFDRFVSRMEAICQRHGEKTMSEWMDNQDVCRMLNISPRTLQTLRDNGTLPYSQINHKTYYRPEDVKRILSVVEDKRKEAKFKGKTI